MGTQEKRPIVVIAGAVLGLAWALTSLVVRVLALPRWLALGTGIEDGWRWRLVAGTLLLPVSVGEWPMHATAAVDAVGAGTAVFVVACLAGVVLGALLAAALTARRWRAVAIGMASCALVLGIIGAGALTDQLTRLVSAEREFFALVAPAARPSRDPATVRGAREFAVRNRDSRWAGEALRIVAMAEAEQGRPRHAAQIWERFGSRFSDRTAPGVAYAHYNVGLCAETVRDVGAAARAYRLAVETIAVRDDGIQSWIAPEAARELARLDRERGRFELARYWTARSEALSGALSIE